MIGEQISDLPHSCNSLRRDTRPPVRVAMVSNFADCRLIGSQ